MSKYVESQGFDIIGPMKCTIVELARRAFNADDVVGVEGNNLYQALFAMN
ncbi:MAG: capsular polysaccharide biosynthesis protein [Candidatus Endobugula sp.]|jgi:capsular polysaccharide biosynthesis protein